MLNIREICQCELKVNTVKQCIGISVGCFFSSYRDTFPVTLYSAEITSCLTFWPSKLAFPLQSSLVRVPFVSLNSGLRLLSTKIRPSIEGEEYLGGSWKGFSSELCP